MFDIGFWELFLIFMLLLFVVGPERLPQLLDIQESGLGNFKGIFFELKDSIQQEAEEPTNQINKLLDDQKITIINSTHDPENFENVDNHLKIDIVDEKRKIMKIIKKVMKLFPQDGEQEKYTLGDILNMQKLTQIF